MNSSAVQSPLRGIRPTCYLLPSVEMSHMRVAECVAHGGHDIPSKDIERRFPRSLHNLLNEFAARADQTRCFMNSGPAPQPVFQQTGDNRIVLHAAFLAELILKTKS